jgi:hypothetical protein
MRLKYGIDVPWYVHNQLVRWVDGRQQWLMYLFSAVVYGNGQVLDKESQKLTKKYPHEPRV